MKKLYKKIKDWIDAIIVIWNAPSYELPYEPKREEGRPCRRHYFLNKPFENCSDCGWSGEIISEDTIKIYEKTS